MQFSMQTITTHAATALIGMAAAAFGLGGCANPDVLLHAQADDFAQTAVAGVLLPAYQSDVRWTVEQKANVTAAVNEHQAFLDTWIEGLGQ